MDKKISETEIVINDITYKSVPEVKLMECDGCAFHLPSCSYNEHCTIFSFKVNSICQI